jgi:hypothetical protein
MKDPQIVLNMNEAVLERQHPAITRWNRLEGRPRAQDFSRALKAEVRDALWMLSKQWQMGEFQGDDAGSPVLARACIDLMAIDRFQAAEGPAEAFSMAAPLEARVERRPLLLRTGDQYLSLDLRLAVGRRWMKLLEREAARPGGLSADYRSAYLDLYKVPVPDPNSPADAAVCAHPDAWSQVSAAAERLVDGIALLEHLDEPGGEAFDGVNPDPADEPKLTALAVRLRAWFQDLFYQPAPAGSAGSHEAWIPDRLEYQFGVSAQDGLPLRGEEGEANGREFVMRAEEYYQGHLDWYALERFPQEAILGQPPQPSITPRRSVSTFLPAPVVFEGMPNTRWWAFEDRRTNFGDIKPDSTDLGKLLLMEFALVYANDWFVLPYTLPVGQVAEVKGIAISNVFDERFWIEPAPEQPGGDWSHWSLFKLSTTAAERVPPPSRLVLLPTTPKIQESAAIEEAALIRDEMANMVWGIEHRISLPTGVGRPGGEAAREYLAHLKRLAGPPPAPPEPVAPVRYQVMNTVPEQWIPFIPVHVEGSVREIQLQRAALPRVLPNRPVEKIRPRTSLLRQNLPKAYFIFEEEVPRAGAVVWQSYQRTRWLGGKVFTWFGARKGTGRGEGSSGLRFDYLADAKS